jgi:outer membrane protein OmpA-like peptidoglycan-associated protein
MRKLQARYLFIASAFAIGVPLGCASVAPKELVDARAAYLQAANGPAAKLAPSQLDTARKALDRAEKEFVDHPDELKTRDYAYIAHRQAQLAKVKGTTEKSGMQKTQADARLSKDLKQDLATSKEENRAYREELADSKQQLDTEKQARIAAEDQAAMLIGKLEKIASVKRQEDRIVISLSGSVLFASGKSTLLPGASTSLDSVADALRELKEPQKITIEGHTDSMGSDDANHALSFRRAQSVHAYLVSRNIDTQMEAVGVGEAAPIADNATAEGRANNRRVEIIVSPNPR